PALRDRAQTGRRGTLDLLQFFAIAIRRAAIDLILRELRRLAAETVDALQRADRRGEHRSLDPRQLFGGRAFAQEALQFFVNGALDRRDVATRLDHGVDGELRADFKWANADADTRCDLVLI